MSFRLGWKTQLSVFVCGCCLSSFVAFSTSCGPCFWSTCLWYFTVAKVRFWPKSIGKRWYTVSRFFYKIKCAIKTPFILNKVPNNFKLQFFNLNLKITIGNIFLFWKSVLIFKQFPAQLFSRATPIRSLNLAHLHRLSSQVLAIFTEPN